MTDELKNGRYQPATVTPPGATLADLLEERGVKQAELATRMGVTPKFINELIGGNVSITPPTAISLEMALGVSADFWLARDARYQEAKARAKANVDLSASVSWLEELPLSDMKKYGLIGSGLSKIDTVRECLRYFAVSTVDAWRQHYLVHTVDTAAYRKSPRVKSQPGSIATWLRGGEIAASKQTCASFSRPKFLAAIDQARALTLENDPKKFIPKLQSMFADCGVAVVFMQAPKHCPVNGVARWLNPEKALIQLSFRGGTNDSMWFTFFHESGHIALHGKKMLFLDFDQSMTGTEEAQADQFARDKLISPTAWASFQPATLTEQVIRAFAAEIGVGPGIVLGRLQNDGRLPWNAHPQLKARCKWGTEE